MVSKYVVEVHNARHGFTGKEFTNMKDAVAYIKSHMIETDTYCYLYELKSINLNKFIAEPIKVNDILD